MNTLYRLMADVLSGCYAVTHNYALAIALLTLAAVGLTTPLTWKSTRGMLAMQMLAPEIKKLQAKYKGDKEALNREMMALYRENNINPLAGCLPLLPQMVVFFVLYRTIYNLSHRITFTVGKAATAAQVQAAAVKAHCPSLVGLSAKSGSATDWTCADPQNVSKGSHIYQNLVSNGGHMKVWGFDLTLGVRTAHGSAVIGCWILVVLVVAAYWFQTKQMSSRNPQAAAANPQMQTMQKIFPFFFGFISITIQAGVNVYFLVSALCRIGQQSLMYRHDPVLRRHVENAKKAGPIDVKATEKKGFFASLQEAFGPTPDAPPGRNRGGPAARPSPKPPRPPARPEPSPAELAADEDLSTSEAEDFAPDDYGPDDYGPEDFAEPEPPPAPASTGPQSRWSRIWAAASGADNTATRQQTRPAPRQPTRRDPVGSNGSGSGSGNGSGNGSGKGSGSAAVATSGGTQAKRGGGGSNRQSSGGGGNRQQQSSRNRSRRKRARRSR